MGAALLLELAAGQEGELAAHGDTYAGELVTELEPLGAQGGAGAGAARG
ncbi:MAG: hypothetical protein M3P95_07660 [Actinomycetota bacterium]|nr:hypothetical protein [Actinomycetota bacterium]